MMEEEQSPKPSVDISMQPDDSLPEISLEDLPEEIQKAARRNGWNSLMPVQAMSIPYVLAGRNLMVQSRTGSGKTGAFLLPIFQLVDFKVNATQALILVPEISLTPQTVRRFTDRTSASVVVMHSGLTARAAPIS